MEISGDTLTETLARFLAKSEQPFRRYSELTIGERDAYMVKVKRILEISGHDYMLKNLHNATREKT